MEGSAAPLALVVGGTGMLAGVVRALVEAGHRTAVVARDTARVRRVAGTTCDPARVVPVAADYAVLGALREALRPAAGDRAVVSPAVLWVHSPHRPSVHEAVAGVLAEGAVVLDVLGSSAADPSREAQEVREWTPAAFAGVASCTYRQVVLGFADGPAGTRWLTHEEICDGVLAAVTSASAAAADTGVAAPAPPSDGEGRGAESIPAVVGRVRPWADRPG